VNCYAAYQDLAPEIKATLANVIGIHDSLVYNTRVRAAGSTRPVYSEEKQKKKPPLPHPMVFNHPMTGKPVLYCDPGRIARIEGLPEEEGNELLEHLCNFQLQPKYQYQHEWTEGDVLIWDNLATLHCATLDYAPEEPRLMKRCQIVTPLAFVTPMVRERLGVAGTA
jgi:taurine dioxygenase